MAEYRKACSNSCMKKLFSKHWNSSKQPRKQRKYLFNSPLNIKHRFLGAHLSKELINKYKIKTLPAKKDDEVIIKRGQFKGKKGRIEKINLRKTRIYIKDIQVMKRDGNKAYYPIHPSNVIITELNTKDKERIKAMERKVKK